MAAARVAGLAAVAIGTLVLVGWVSDVRALKQVAPELTAMKANTAAMFVVAGLGLRAVAGGDVGRRPRPAAALAGAFAVLLAGLTLVEYAWRDLGIDQLVFADADPVHPGRPSPHTAVAFVFVGVDLLLLASPGRLRSAARWANAVAAAVVAAGVIGFAYGVDYLRGDTAVTGIAFHTLVGLTLLVLGLAFVQPSAGWIAVFTASGPGGRAARLFAPLVALTPVLVGLEHRFFDSTLGRAGIAIGISGISVALLLWGAASLERVEAERVQLEGLLPICAHCKSIRDDGGYWSALDSYIESHSEASFTHSICSSCMAEHYPEVAAVVEAKLAGEGRSTLPPAGDPPAA